MIDRRGLSNEQRLADALVRRRKVQAARGLGLSYEAMAPSVGLSVAAVAKILNTYGPKIIPAPGGRLLPLGQRFWSKVRCGTQDECWEWAGALSSKGYGHIGYLGRVREAHVVSFIIANGPYPADLDVLHNCDNRRCVNPGHLRLGTHQDNMRDMKVRGRARNGTTGPIREGGWVAR